MVERREFFYGIWHHGFKLMENVGILYKPFREWQYDNPDAILGLS